MPLDLDFSGVDKPERKEPIADDWHVVVVTDASETDVTKVSPGFNVTLEIESSQDHGDKFRSRWIYDTLWASEKSLPYLREKLEALGMNVPDGPISIDARELIGLRAAVRTHYGIAKGRTDQTPRVSVVAYDRLTNPDLPTTPGADDWRKLLPEDAPSSLPPDEKLPF